MTDSVKDRADMWFDAVMKMRQGIQMQYQDTEYDDNYVWTDWVYDPENPTPPDFDDDLIWREKPVQNNLSTDEKFEEYLNVLRKIHAGIRMEYTSTYWDNNKYVEWDDESLPEFDASETWRECQSKDIEENKIRQIMIVPNYSYDCSGRVTITLNVKIHDDEPETIHRVTPGNPFYIVI